jgi:hypothetical protein
MKFRYDAQLDIVIPADNGVETLETLYSDDLRKPIFIDVISQMSSKVGSFRKASDGNFHRTEEICGNLGVLQTLNLD